MMFDYLGEKATGSRIEKAVTDVLVEGKVRTYDLGGTSSTSQVAEAISEKLGKESGEIGGKGRRRAEAVIEGKHACPFETRD